MCHYYFHHSIGVSCVGWNEIDGYYLYRIGLAVRAVMTMVYDNVVYNDDVVVIVFLVVVVVVTKIDMI